MANQRQLLMILQGVANWNTWRKEHPQIHPDLSEANLSRANLTAADLSEANLSEADLSEADLSGANLSGADLSGANLVNANLLAARLSFANLIRAKLTWANLSVAFLNEANLSEANLSGVNFNRTLLTGANFSQASIMMTQFGEVDLRMIQGLDTVNHLGPSNISTSTLESSGGNIPEAFLRGAGLSDNLIEYAHSLVSRPIEYYTCFISYSSKDEEFVNYLYADLQHEGIRCWFAPENLKIGDKFWHRIDELIRQHDKLLVVLSEHSVISTWVEREVMAALEKEQQQKALVLFPIALDNAVELSTEPWAAVIRRSRYIGNFTRWKDHHAYQQAFSRLIRALIAGEPKERGLIL